MGLLTWNGKWREQRERQDGPRHSVGRKKAAKKSWWFVFFNYYFLISLITAEVRPEVCVYGGGIWGVVLLIVAKMCLLLRVSSIARDRLDCEAWQKQSGTLLEVREHWGCFKIPKVALNNHITFHVEMCYMSLWLSDAMWKEKQANMLRCAYELASAEHFKQGVTEIRKRNGRIFFQTIDTQPSTGW